MKIFSSLTFMAIKLLLLMMFVLLTLQEVSAQVGSLALPGCQEKCGDITIPYPFGIGEICSANDTFIVTCDNSFNPPKPFLSSISSEVVEILLYAGTVHVSNPFNGTNCENGVDSLPRPTFSDNQKQFTVVLDWSTHWNCNATKASTGSSLCGRMASCSSNGLCECLDGYVGNPYMLDGCQDIDECSPTKYNGTINTYYGAYTVYNRCSQICMNKPGSYSCSCYYGYESSVDGYTCNPYNKTLMAIVATCSSLGGLTILILTWWLYKVLITREQKRLKDKFFKKNGGLLLQQQISSGEGTVENSKLFTSKELEKATDNYNVDRILGQGGQGTVYKGMLTDGRIVAVKKSKIMFESKVEQFINEVVILSQINHRNIVKLHGCCLETEVPLLVYEFIPNGTLFQYIHENNEKFQLTWDARLRVAIEVAGALSYLHSEASMPIYHRDIKSINILLDEKYRAKVADFGTSRLLAVDQTHLTTRVQGTFGYFDPEYFRSNHFTDKSDVYSFGVVLVELLTGLEPIFSARPDYEKQSLVTLFVLAMEENRLFDILDARVMEDGQKEEIVRFANLAYRCLNLSGRRRPTMKQVATELESIRMLDGPPNVKQQFEEAEYALNELRVPWETTSISLNSSARNVLSLDMEPLIYST